MNARVEVWQSGRLLWTRSFPNLPEARAYASLAPRAFAEIGTVPLHALLVY